MTSLTMQVICAAADKVTRHLSEGTQYLGNILTIEFD